MNFFTRIDGLDLTPGNKSAGFLFAVSAPALHLLSTVVVDEADYRRLLESVQSRVKHSGLLPAELEGDCSLELYEGTAVPKLFWVARGFACSLGAEPEALREVVDPAQVAYLGPELVYSPHNVDAPQHALILMILAQTWAEWAWGKLLVAQDRLAKKEEGDDGKPN